MRGVSTFTSVGVQAVVSGLTLALIGARRVDAHRVAVAVVALLAALRRTLVYVCKQNIPHQYTLGNISGNRHVG